MARNRKANLVGTITATSLNVESIILVSGQDVSGQANNAYAQANAAYSQANSAYTQGNSAYSQANNAYSQANSAYGQANSSYSQANSAYTQANTATTNAANAHSQANNAYSQANSAYGAANTAQTTAQNAYTQANNSYGQANSAYNQANTATTNAGNAYSQANTATTIAGNAYGQANTAYNAANTAQTAAQDAYAQANSAYSQSNNAYTQANSAYAQANLAYTQANTAFTAANNSNLKLGGVITGTLNVTNDIIVGGNVYLQGNTTYINVSTYQINDSLMYIAANNILTDSVDIGFVGAKNTSGAFSHTGFARDATDGKYKLFDNLPDSGHVGNVIDFANTSLATLVANVEASSILLSGNAVATNVSVSAAYGQANLAYSQANNAYSQANSGYTQANNAYSQANSGYTQANNAYSQANSAYGQANSAYGAANNRVLKAGDTMTGQLNVSSGGLIINGYVGGTTGSPIASFTKTVVIGANNYNQSYNTGNSVLLLISDYSNDGGDNVFPIWVEDENNLVDFYLNSGTNGTLGTKRAYFGGSVGIGNTSPTTGYNSKFKIGTASVDNYTNMAIEGGTESSTYWAHPIGYAQLYNSYGTIGLNAYLSGEGKSLNSSVIYFGGYNDTANAYLQLFDNKLHIAGGGNVGIGTTSPAVKLHVDGNVRIGVAATTALAAGNQLQSFQAGQQYITSAGYDECLKFVGYRLSATDSYGMGVSTSLLELQSASAIGFFVGGTNPKTRISTITSNGLGVGVTSVQASASSLSIEASGCMLVGGPLNSHQTSRGVFEWNSNITRIRAYGATSNTGILAFNAGGGGGLQDNEYMRIDNVGNVAIGTTSTSSKLHIVSGSAESTGFTLETTGSSGKTFFAVHKLGYVRLRSSDTNGAAVHLFDNAGSKRAELGIGADSKINWYSDALAATWLVFDGANNRVGIGTDDPRAPLYVRGDGTSNNARAVIRIDNTGSDKWSFISLPDAASGGDTAANNYYLIGRTASFTNRTLSFHIPKASDYGSGSEPQIGFYSTGADLLFSVQATTGNAYIKGNVGIGTSPGNLLHLYGASNPFIRVQTGGGQYSYLRLDDGSSNGYLIKNVSAETTNGALAGALYTYTDNNKAFQHIHAGVPLFTILSNGNVGINTTSPSSRLDIAVSSTMGTYGPGTYNLRLRNTNTAETNSGAVEFIGHSGNATTPYPWATISAEKQTSAGDANYGGKLHLWTTSGGANGEANSGQYRRLTIDSAGNVGIGTVSPQGKQHNYIASRSTGFSAGDGTTWHDLIIQNPNNTQGAAVGIAFELNSAYHSNAGTGIAAVKSTASSDYGADMVFVTRPQSAGAAEQMRITSGGSVLIGTTSATTGSKFEIAGSGIWSGGMITLTNTGTSGRSWSIFSTNSSFDQGAGKLLVYNTTGGTNALVIDSSNNVGIGTPNPISKTTITRAVTNTVTLADSNNASHLTLAGSDALVRLQLGCGGASLGYAGWIQASYDNTGGAFGVEPLLLNPSGGNVGIGTTNPLYKLDVTGAIRSTLEVYSTRNAGNNGFISLTSGSGSNMLPMLNGVSENNGLVGFYFIVDKSANQSAVTGYTAGAFRFTTNFNQTSALLFAVDNNYSNKFAIDYNGNVGIGTTSPGQKLHVEGKVLINAGTGASTFDDLNIGGISGWSNTEAHRINFVYGTASSPSIFTTIESKYNSSTNLAELRFKNMYNAGVGTATVMTLLGSGFVGINVETAYETGDIFRVQGVSAFVNNGAKAMSVGRNTNTGTLIEFFYAGGGGKGTITTDGTNVAYNTSSDRRLKLNIQPADSASSVIDGIQIVKHDWNTGKHTRYGVVAQDLYNVAPEAVSVGDSEEIENPRNPWGVDYSKLVPILIKEIQELRARVAVLEAK